MIKNYLKIAFRNLRKDKSYTFINLTGLSVGLAVCLIIAIFIQFHLGFDTFHSNSENIYRIIKQDTRSGQNQKRGNMQGPLGTTLVEEIPEVKSAVRFRAEGEQLVTIGNEIFYQNGLLMTDPEMFEIFDFEVLQGNKDLLLANENSIVLSENTAQKFFGDTNPIGQQVILDEENNYTVSGIIENAPMQSHLNYTMIIRIPDQMRGTNVMKWNLMSAFYTYLLLEEDQDPSAVIAKIPSVLEGKLNDETLDRTKYMFQPLTDIHLTSDLGWELFSDRIFSMNYIYLFGIVGIFILLIAAVNYINLATARASRRLKEVGIRKTAGAHRLNLFWQFTGEVLMITFIAAGFSLGITELLLPSINNLMGLELSSATIWSPFFIFGFIGVVFLIGFTSGIYPALILSSFSPSDIFKPSNKMLAGGSLRKGLVVTQFAISMTLVISTLIIDQQLDYFQSKNLGLNPDQVVNIELEAEGAQNKAGIFADELAKIPGIESYTISNRYPGVGGIRVYLFLNENDEEPTPVHFNSADPNFLKTMGMEIVSGRNFNDSDAQKEENFILANQTLIDNMGWTDEEAVGKKISRYTVLGVIRDFHFESFQNEITASAIGPIGSEANYVSARLNSQDIPATMTQIEESWKSIAGAYPFQYSFMDQTFDDLYRAEQRLGVLFTGFALITIFIACMGLFGLVAFMASKRTKEIGIRKVLGASVTNLVALLSKDFVLLVVAGFILAIPIAWYAMNQWLANFAYRIEIGAGIFILAGAAALVIAFLTVSWQSVKAAVANPVESLRNE